MKFSIITPSRNQGRFISCCLASIYAQSHPLIEHIVVDGLSSDSTSEIVKNYPSTLIERADNGPAQAINRGLEIASGDIVCWLNADDAFSGPDVLQRVRTLFEQHPEIDVITGDGYYIDESGRLLAPIIPDRAKYMSYTWMRRGDSFLQPATFWRRNGIRLNESLRYTFDWQLWLDFYAAGLNIRYVSECFAFFRQHPESLTQQDPGLRRHEVHSLLSKYGDSRAQLAWAWLMWKLYLLDEQMNTDLVRKSARAMNRLLDMITGGRLNAG